MRRILAAIVGELRSPSSSAVVVGVVWWVAVSGLVYRGGLPSVFESPVFRLVSAAAIAYAWFGEERLHAPP